MLWCATRPSKTEIGDFSSWFTNTGGDLGTVSISGTVVTSVSLARILGVILDNFLNFSSRINAICKSVTIAIKNVGRARKYLNQVDTERLVHAFVMSNL